jgi:hypothetical protein
MAKKLEFKFSNFPQELIESLKRKCQMNVPPLSRFYDDYGIVEKKSLQMNKLESHLLKLNIAFIRLAHCPRGPYLKVKGNMALITADVPHSLHRILPATQNLIPVSFKRKLAYSGAYIEQLVNREKLMMYFNFFKEFNHLYKEVEFDEELLEEFQDETIEEARISEQQTSAVLESVRTNVQRDALDSDDDDDPNDEDDMNAQVNPSINVDEPIPQSEQDSIFMNKYQEDTNVFTVVNKFADTVIEYERNMKLRGISLRDEFYDSEMEEDGHLENKDYEPLEKKMKPNDSMDEITTGNLDDAFVIDDEIFMSDNEEEIFLSDSEIEEKDENSINEENPVKAVEEKS